MGETSDHTEAFAAQLKRYRWAAWAMLALLLVVLASPLLLLADVSRSGFTLFLTGVAVPMVLLLVPCKKMSTCPACDRFMGRDIGTHCGLCGTRIRKSRG